MTRASGTGAAGEAAHEIRDLWPHDFGRDELPELFTPRRPVRAHDLFRPDVEDDEFAAGVMAELLARVDGRRSS